MTVTTTRPPTGAVPAPTPGRRRSRRSGAIPLAAPAVAFIALSTLVPVAVTLVRVVADGPASLRRIAEIPDLLPVLWRTLEWTVASVVGALLIGMGGALLFRTGRLRHAALWRSVVMIPWIIPGVVGATVWRWTLSTDYGLLNQQLMDLGVIRAPIAWLSDPSIVLFVVAVVQVWVTAPFAVLMLSAALSGIPEERLEAARLDGASGLALVRAIVVPAVRGTVGIVTLTLAIWALNSFTIIYVMTSGGPAGASTILPILLVDAFQDGDVALTSAIAVLQLVICAVFAIVSLRAAGRDEEV